MIALVGNDIGQQGEMAGALDFTRKLALAARAIAGLSPRLDLAALIEVTREHVNIFVVEASALGAIGGSAAAAPSPASAMRPAASTSRALGRGPGFSLRLSACGVVTHDWFSPYLLLGHGLLALAALKRFPTACRPQSGAQLYFAFISNQEVAKHGFK